MLVIHIPFDSDPMAPEQADLARCASEGLIGHAAAPRHNDRLDRGDKLKGIFVEETAARLARGITLMFADMGLAALAELPLPNGRRADLVAIDDKGQICIVEIKSSRVDFMTDRKWQDYLEFCDRFFFGVALDFPQEILPPDCGLILADGHGGAIIRPAAVTPLHAARRRAQILRIAQAACRRLMRIDPEGKSPEQIGA